MVHLVLQPPVLVLGEVGEAAGRDLHQLALDVQRSRVEQLLGLEFKDLLLRLRFSLCCTRVTRHRSYSKRL